MIHIVGSFPSLKLVMPITGINSLVYVGGSLYCMFKSLASFKLICYNRLPNLTWAELGGKVQWNLWTVTSKKALAKLLISWGLWFCSFMQHYHLLLLFSWRFITHAKDRGFYVQGLLSQIFSLDFCLSSILSRFLVSAFWINSSDIWTLGELSYILFEVCFFMHPPHILWELVVFGPSLHIFVTKLITVQPDLS